MKHKNTAVHTLLIFHNDKFHRSEAFRGECACTHASCMDVCVLAAGSLAPLHYIFMRHAV